jgi:hypothetical protein
MQKPRGVCRGDRRIRRIHADAIGQFCGSQGLPTQSLRRPEAEIVWANR